MSYLFLASFVAGLLLAVRLMFFGAERRTTHRPGELTLRRSEPAIIGFLVMFGVAGYLLSRRATMSLAAESAIALLLGVAWAGLVARVAVATARLQPEHDPDDPRYLLQGRVAVVTTEIPVAGEGMLIIREGDTSRSLRARASDESGIAEGLEVCIERVDGDVAYVERWSVVEARL